MITKINTNVPKQTNHRIIDLLYKVGTWSFGFDNHLNKKLNTVNAGLTYASFQAEKFYVSQSRSAGASWCISITAPGQYQFQYIRCNFLNFI